MWGQGVIKNSVLVALVLLLTACAGNAPAPISARTPPPSEKILCYQVDDGDTLFSIAWRNEIDLKLLAAINGIQPPYTIYTGQVLSLDTSRASRKTSTQRATTKPKPKPVSASKPATSSTTAAVSKSPVRKPVATPKLTGKVRWSWPVKGRVTRQFGADKLFKGIDITSLPGAPVYPAADGVVVYAGTGLRGYGKLIIIKHSSVYLSAYAHSRKILVKEGQAVTRQQKIGEVGGDPSNARRFYFEIRKDGKPVNPLQYLK